MELLGLVNGFALSYGGAQAALAEERARTGVTAQEQADAQVAGLVSAAASGQYPNLAAALAGPPAPGRDADEIFDRCVLRLIDGALRHTHRLVPRRGRRLGRPPGGGERRRRNGGS